MYSKDLRQKEIFHIKREVGLRLNLVVGRKDVVEEAEVVGGGGRYGGLVWECIRGFSRMLPRFSPKISKTAFLEVWFGITDDSSGFL